LNIAYRFGSIFLAEPFPGGAGRPDLAIELLQKGARARPEKWEYLQDIGFVYYWWLHDFEMAAKWFNRAADVEGAPWWLRSLAGMTMAEGGDRSSSRRIWESLLETPDNEWLRNDARWRLRQLDAMDFIDELQARVDQLTASTGQPPARWEELVRMGLLPGIPVDSDNTPYILDLGRVRVSPESDLFPLPDEPKRPPPGM
jgi:TPR repeat protein